MGAIDFEDIIVDDRELDRIPGGILGYSYRLRSELIEIAPKLGIQLSGDLLYPVEAARVEAQAESERGLWLEQTVWY